MLRLISVIFIMLFVFSNNVYAQQTKDTLQLNYTSDTILTTDGSVIITSVIAIDSINGLMKYVNPKNSRKIKNTDLDEIYSVKNRTGENILYKPDTSGNTYSAADMRYFIYGQQDAKKRKFAVFPFIANTLLSAGAGATGSFFSPLAPLAFTALFSIPHIKIRNEHVSNPAYLNNEAYVAGYKQEAYRRRKVQTILGGGIGLVVGLCTSFYLRAHDIPLPTKTY